ncbi:arabinogalactan endo-1,4-beta-galactosidase [Dentipellis sp. KUC8613]|nr:arabinogalactan endo-1,4-beta-galactosidase [Dentipellis sp. KUC8613]
MLWTPLVSILCAFVAHSLALTFRGSDLSSLVVVENQGVHFTDNGSQQPFERILVNHGSNAARIRVWTAGQYDTSYALNLAKRQAIPSGWPTTLSGLNTQVYTYTQSLVQQFANQGTPIDILQVGNEINNGLLWPVGQISVNGINPVSQLLHSAINGAKSAGSPRILIHLANGWDWSGLSSFFKGVFIPGALATSDIDIIGVSFYPFYDAGATLSALKSSLTNLANTYGKPIVVAETDWPVSCSGVQLTEPSIPVSTSGQETWITDIKNVLTSLPNGLGQGIFYWEPGWVGSANLGSACADNLLVTSSGATRTSINIFQDMQ